LQTDVKTMLTPKQASLIDDLKNQLSPDEKQLCEPVIEALST